MTIFSKVQKAIKAHSMIAPGETIIVAFSGGPDSMALLYLLEEIKQELGIRIASCHLNHKLRGNESDQDVEFCRKQAEFLGIEHYGLSLDVKKIADSRGWNLEETGRICRHAFYRRALRKLLGHKIATGHHKDDQAETVLLNLIRGSGEAGLAGIAPMFNERIIRPLIYCSREELLFFLEEKQLAFRMDRSNEDTNFVRNRIRHKIIPMIKKEFNPQIADSLSRTAELQRDALEFSQELADAFFNKIIMRSKNGLEMNRIEFNPLPKHLKRIIIRRCFEELSGEKRGISFEHVENLINASILSATGKNFLLPGNLIARTTQDNIVVSKYNHSDEGKIEYYYTFEIPGKIEIPELGLTWKVEKMKRINITPQMYQNDPFTECFSASKLGKEIEVRSRKPGDRMRPLGLRGTKKIKDILIDRKVPRSERRVLPLMLSGGEIFWLSGVSISEEFKVTEEEEDMMLFSLIEKSGEKA